ncbi:MAG: peptide chain release factor N(5)-glutamine methyltransferase [Solirubrobacteraceae bacterium]
MIRLGEAALAPAAGTVRELLAAARAALQAAGCDAPRLDAELLLAEVLEVPRARLVLDRDEPVPSAARARFEDLVARREAREPVAYILGRREFRHLLLTVDARVLIPRPETELLVEVGLELPQGATVLDVGTGSGAVALALKDERPDLAVRGTDISPDAVAVARANAERLGLDVGFKVADLLGGEMGDVDAVLANLPYVPSGESLMADVALYEPATALFAGADGLALVQRLIAEASAIVQASATARLRLLALEIDPRQAAEVAALLREAGLHAVEVRRDLAGRERVVVGRR